MNDQIVHTTDAAFDTDVVKSSQPVLLDFWAEWCTPCKMIAPILDVIADEYKDRLRVVKLNIDENPKTPPKYNVRGIPTLLVVPTAPSRRSKSARSRKRNSNRFSTRT